MRCNIDVSMFFEVSPCDVKLKMHRYTELQIIILDEN
jgi:hypothetical protein